MTTYRVGRHQPQNVYRDDQYIGVMFTAEDAQLVVEALNGEQPAICLAWVGGGGHCELPHGHGGACVARAVNGPAMAGQPTRFDERADVRRRIAERAEHRPSSLGDGFGYGPCVGCGELWPCKASREGR